MKIESGKNSLENILSKSVDILSASDPQHYSSLEMAASLGMSESDFLALFPRKESLIQECRTFLEKDFFVRAVASSQNGINFEATFNALLDHYIAYPTFIRFALSYDYVFPRRELPADYAEYKTMVIEELVKPLDQIRPVKGDLEMGYQLTDHWVRDLILDCELIIDGVVPDTPAMRHLMVKAIEDGLFSFNKIPGTPE
jgi:hypothetical protein